MDPDQRLSRPLVAKPMVESAADRRDFWAMLKALAGIEEPSQEPTREEIEEQVPADRGEKDVEKWIARGEKYN